MNGWQKQARATTVKPAGVAVGIYALMAAGNSASAQIVANPDGSFSALTIESAHTAMVWQLLVGGFVVVAFLAAVILWISTALRRARHANIRRAAFVSGALNNLANGIVMLDAQKRVVFCNDCYLKMYGLDRFDLFPGMTGRDLLQLRKERGFIEPTIEEYARAAEQSEGYVCDLKDGRSILIKHRNLANGGLVSTHEDCTEQRKLANELADSRNFLESVIDNIPVCVAAKSIDDGRYILANRAFEQFAGVSRDQIIGSTAHTIYGIEAAKAVDESDREALESPVGPVRNELTIDHHGGYPRDRAQREK